MFSPSRDPTRKFDFPQCRLQCKYHTPVLSTQIWSTIHFGAELTNTGFNSRQMLNSDLTNTDNSGLDKYWQLPPKSYNCPHSPSLYYTVNCVEQQMYVHSELLRFMLNLEVTTKPCTCQISTPFPPVPDIIIIILDLNMYVLCTWFFLHTYMILKDHPINAICNASFESLGFNFWFGQAAAL